MEGENAQKLRELLELQMRAAMDSPHHQAWMDQREAVRGFFAYLDSLEPDHSATQLQLREGLMRLATMLLSTVAVQALENQDREA